jgi:ketol-acid reductoisomerase
MRKRISDTAKWGELTVGPKIIDQSVQRRMRSTLAKVQSGKFAREFISEIKTGRRRYMNLLREAEKHPSWRGTAGTDGLARKNVGSPALHWPSSAPFRQIKSCLKFIALLACARE